MSLFGVFLSFASFARTSGRRKRKFRPTRNAGIVPFRACLTIVLGASAPRRRTDSSSAMRSPFASMGLMRGGGATDIGVSPGDSFMKSGIMPRAELTLIRQWPVGVFLASSSPLSQDPRTMCLLRPVIRETKPTETRGLSGLFFGMG